MCLIVSVSFFSEKKKKILPRKPSLISWKNGSADGHAESTTACADGGSGNRGFQADTSKLFSFFKPGFQADASPKLFCFFGPLSA
jgi:hypothetical protein